MLESSLCSEPSDVMPMEYTHFYYIRVIKNTFAFQSWHPIKHVSYRRQDIWKSIMYGLKDNTISKSSLVVESCTHWVDLWDYWPVLLTVLQWRDWVKKQCLRHPDLHQSTPIKQSYLMTWKSWSTGSKNVLKWFWLTSSVIWGSFTTWSSSFPVKELWKCIFVLFLMLVHNRVVYVVLLTCVGFNWLD